MFQKPWLRATHPGYYRIAWSVILAHVVLAVDSFLPGRHDAPVFTYVKPLLAYYGVMHVIVACVLVLTLFVDERWWGWSRAMFFVSLLTFNTYATGMLFGFFYTGGSLVGPIGLVALSISSAAAWREPTSGPTHRSIHHRAT